MTDITVIHDSPMEMGGAEAVFMHTLQALQDDYEVTTVTAEPCDPTQLNEYYNLSVHNVDFTTPSIPLLAWASVNAAADWITSGPLGMLEMWQRALFHRVALWNTNADLIIHTFNESPYGSPSIQYIHHPTFRRFPSEGANPPDNPKLALFEKIVTPLRSADDFPPDALFLTNSAWTASDLKSVYGIDASVCPPPVQTDDISSPDADRNQRNAVIMVGHIAPFKCQHLAFDILDAVREKGYDLELTIVGPTFNASYREHLESRASNRDWATVRGQVSRDELVQLLHSHRYGLHAYEYEHFGIAVAEMVAAGCLPLVPNGGGQVEIVNNASELIWQTPDEAAELLGAFCEDSNLRERVRSKLPQIEQTYGAERFQNEMRKHVDSIL